MHDEKLSRAFKQRLHDGIMIVGGTRGHGGLPEPIQYMGYH
jgi:hypothetical protein